MAHKEQAEFCTKVKNLLPQFFENKKVLDVGSLDINGNNKFLFKNCDYTGIDIGHGKNVDYVTKTHEYDAPSEYYDVIISTECFEHDMFYELSIENSYRMLKKGGLFLFTCATTGRPEHGTRKTTPQDAPLLLNYASWSDYYKNLTEEDIKKFHKVSELYSDYKFEVNNESHDLYFYGIKSEKENEEADDDLVSVLKKNNFDTDKYSLGYIDGFYNRLFNPLKSKPINFLEIGTFKGGSIKLWREFFHPDSKINCMDVLYCQNLKDVEGINQIICNAYLKESADQFKDEELDIIVDDGPHTLDSFVSLIDLYYSKLKDGGILVIEDIINLSWTPILKDLAEKKGFKKIEEINMAEIGRAHV